MNPIASNFPAPSSPASSGPGSLTGELDLSTTRLAVLVNQKSRLVQELHKLVGQQRRLIEQQEADLIPLLAVKQRVLETLQEVDRAMDPFRSQDPESRNWATPAARLACRDEAEQCETLFRQVLLIENHCQQVLLQQQDKTRQQLQGAVGAGHASRAYQQTTRHPHQSAPHLDLTSEG